MSVSITYQLDVSNDARGRLAADTTTENPNATFSYPVKTPPTSAESTSSATYYAELSRAIRGATSEVGDRLTEWRDAVGNDEKEKERVAAAAAQARKAADEDSEEEEAL